jgi:hypothetical protein
MANAMLSASSMTVRRTMAKQSEEIESSFKVFNPWNFDEQV